MKPVLNPLVFSQVNSDSASLTMLTSTIHKVSEAGSYDGTIMRGSDIVGIFRLNAIDLSPTDCATEAKSQVNIDLKSLDLPVADHIESLSNNSFQVKTGGYAVFHVSSGAGGYSVELQKTGVQKKTKSSTAKNLAKTTTSSQQSCDQEPTTSQTSITKPKPNLSLLTLKSEKSPNTPKPSKSNVPPKP